MDSDIYSIDKNDNNLDKLSSIVDIQTDDLKKLINYTIKAKEKAYCPYSKFRVGACLYIKDNPNKFIDGVNIENISYGLSICAERSALCSAISNGISIDKLKTISVCTDKEEFLCPCGACRQFISEFPNLTNIIIINNSGLVKYIKINELIPYVFKTDL